MVDPSEIKKSATPVQNPRWLQFLDAQLALDARSLAVGRIAIAALLLYDLGLRATDLAAHYSDSGVWPRSILELHPWSFVWSLHALGGSPAFEGALFALAAAAGVALLLGWQTRVATLVSFALALSLQARNPFLHDGQDDLLRLLLFWGLWLPLGQRWSLDARASGAAANASSARVSGLRAVGLAGQFLLIYESSALGKLQSGWWTSGHGILHALQLGRYETYAGRWLAQHFAGPLVALSFPVIALEIALPLLLWVPLQNATRRDQLRNAAVALAVLLHGSFWIFLRLSIFPALSIAGWLLFLPAAVWDRGPARIEQLPPKPLHATPGWWALPFLLAELLYVASTHLGQPLLPYPARRAVEAVGLQQYWVVFSPPDPATVTDGYFVAAGRLADGSQIDLFKPDAQLTWEPPPLVSTSFRNSRWRHFYANLVVEWARSSDQWHDTIQVRETTAKWLCRERKAEHPEGPVLERVSLYFVEHLVDPPPHQPADQPGEVPRRRLLAQVGCL